MRIDANIFAIALLESIPVNVLVFLCWLGIESGSISLSSTKGITGEI